MLLLGLQRTFVGLVVCLARLAFPPVAGSSGSRSFTGNFCMTFPVSCIGAVDNGMTAHNMYYISNSTTPLLAHNHLMQETHFLLSKWQQHRLKPSVHECSKTLQKTAMTIPLVKIAELRGQRKYGLKTRDNYKRTKQDFIATQNPGTQQNP